MDERRTISRTDLLHAATSAGIAVQQAEAIWERLPAGAPTPPTPGSAAVPSAALAPPTPAPHPVATTSTFENVLYYVGGLLVIGAMSIFLTLGRVAFGDWGTLVISFAYVVGFALAAESVYRKRRLVVPGGLLACVAVVVVPLVVYALLQVAGLWDDGAADGTVATTRAALQRLPVELAMLVAALVAIRRYPFALLAVPAAAAGGFLLLDLAGLAFGATDPDATDLGNVALVYGIAVLALALRLDRRTRPDYAFWLYLFAAGAISFWAVASVHPWEHGPVNDVAWVLLCLLGLVIGALLRRAVFLAVAGAGLFTYVAYLSWAIFSGSLLLPFALTGIGLAVIGAGLFVSKRRTAIDAWVQARIPEGMRAQLPSNRPPLA